MADFGLLVLRLVTGALFLVHGSPKLFGGPGRALPQQVKHLLGEGFVPMWERGPRGTGEQFASLGLPFPHQLAMLAGVSQILGGLGLILGLGSRLAALGIAGNMAAAVLVKLKGGVVGQAGYEYPAILLASCVALMFTGPGRYSVCASRVAGPRAR